MANGVLGLGAGAASLNNELIEKLKEADRASSVEPLETSIENIIGEGGETEKIAEIKAKINELLNSVKPLDLFVSGGVNAFEQKMATVSGEAAIFDATDVGKLNTGTTSVDITKLAQRDVFQSSTFTDKDAVISNSAADILTIQHNGADYTFDTNGKTYEQLASEINKNENFTASVEQVGSSDFRLVIKSKEAGLDNALTMTENGALNLGIMNVLAAQNMEATVDGVPYNVSSNTITIEGGLKITANQIGVATINVQEDTSSIETIMTDFVNKYNELVALVDSEIFSADSKIADKSTLRSMMNGVKDTLFSSYGTNDELNIFNAGFELDKSGIITLDSTKFTEYLESNPEDMKSLFLGVAEDKGLGTTLKEYIDDLNSFNGLISSYENNMTSRKESLIEEKNKAIETLDNKYAQLAQQFAAYNGIINQFESQFSGLKLMIEQSVAGN